MALQPRFSSQDLATPEVPVASLKVNPVNKARLHLPGTPLASSQDFLRKDFSELIQGEVAQKIKNGAGTIVGAVNEAKHASVSIFDNISEFGKMILQKTTDNKTATTVLAALGSVYAGILASKNIVNSVKVLHDPKGDQKVSWLFYALQGILEGGLAIGLASPFLGVKSFFSKVIDGRNVVQTRMIAGAVVAPMLLGTLIKIAQGASIFNKLPLGIGPALENIFGTISGAAREITTPREFSQNPNAPGGGLGPGGGGLPAFGAA